VAEAEILGVKVGQPATVTLEALPGRAFAGEVVEVGASALRSWARAPPRASSGQGAGQGPQEGLRPGLTGDAEILVGEAKDALAVPSRRLCCAARRARAPGRLRRRREGRAVLPVETGMIGASRSRSRRARGGREIVAGPWQS